MAMKLDRDQQKAVEHFEESALVVAGPGSGKTTVIKERILNLVHKHNVDPKNILAIAFTNTAADEMQDRLRKADLKGSEPTICTLHVFGKDIITEHYKEAGFSQKPNNIWDDKKIGQIINREKSWLNRENDEKRVAIYKIEDMTTHQCYIGQTINPDRRKEEHFNHSSNRRLREAIQQKGKEVFDFSYEWVTGIEADYEETYRINSYRRRAAVSLNKGYQQTNRENSNTPIIIYKIKSPSTVTCYFGQTTDLESVEKPEGFEVIDKEKTWEEGSIRIEQEIKKYKEWAVFNREDPLYARDSTRRRIEVFCKYFDVSYDEVIKHTQKFEHEMRIFDGMNEDIMKVKSKVYTGQFKPEKINDPILRAFAKKYEIRKTEARAIDFLDMLILSANMLEKTPDLLCEYQEKYRHVFVDEFQDISPVDFRLIKLLENNLFAVGDDDQAIYGFRGGDSEIMQKFREKEDVTEYKVTRNYRSSPTIVRHAKTLIEHNTHRISKNLCAQKSARSRVEVLKTSRDTITENLLNELHPIVTTCETHFKENTPDMDNPLLQELTPSQQIGILARNWYEVNPIQTYLISAVKNKGFQIRWSDSDEKEKRKLTMQRNQKSIEISTIHSAKGREWDKVILLVNNKMKMGPDRKPIPSIPDPRNAVEDERRLFYVAVTRAKQELVILNGGNCQFVPEFQNVPLRKEDIEHAFKEELAVQEPKLKKKLEETSKAALAGFQYKLKQELAKASDTERKQNEVKLNRLRGNITQTENAISELETKLPTALKSVNKNLLEDLIPVLDEFEALYKNLPKTSELNNTTDYRAFTESVQLAQTQLLNSLNDHELKPIEVSTGEIFNPVHHEKIQPAIYSDEVPAGKIKKEKQSGYLLGDQVIRKSQVIISKGENIQIPEQLDRIVEIYLDRLISAFQSKFKLTNIDKLFIIQKMVQYLLRLDGDSIEKIRVFALKEAETIPKGRFADYCVGPEKTHLCSNTFQDFWNKIWETVEQSRKTPETKVKSKPPSPDTFSHVSKTPRITSVKPYRKIDEQARIWDEIVTAHEAGTPVKGHITERIKGGLRVTMGSLRGFLPASQVELRSIQNLEQYVGQTLDLMVISLNKWRHHMVFSRRACLESELAQKRSEFLSMLEVGQMVKGVVKNITTFGAFVDLGSVDGLLHKSEIAWKRISHPSEIVSIGKDIEVKVIEFDRENEKISLSLKQLTNDPWENAEEKYPVGSKIRGIVTNVVHYGAFIQLKEGMDGLIHISEMPTDSRETLPSDILNKDDEVEVIVIKISKDSRRISLRMIANLSRSFEDPRSDPTPNTPVPKEKIEESIPNNLPESITITPTEHTEDTLPVPEESSFDGETNATIPCEPINTPDIQPIEETVDRSHPMPEDFSEILKPQIQNLKPALSEENTGTSIETTNNIPNQSTELIDSKPPQKMSNSPLSIETSHEDVQKDERQDQQRKLEHHLRKFGRFVLRKLKQK